jgi:hypothetical protein
MGDQVGAVPGRLLEVRGGKAIVNVQDEPAPRRQLAQPFQIDEVEGGVRGRLHEIIFVLGWISASHVSGRLMSA